HPLNSHSFPTRRSRHCEIKKIGSRLSRSHTRNVSAVFLQVIRDLGWLKLRRNPEITEKENHCRESNVMGPAGGKRAGNPRSCRAVSKSILDNCCRKEKQRPSEDDGHYAGVIDFQR